MAVFAVIRVGELAPGLIIAPERYHPGRLLPAAPDAVSLGELAAVRAEIVSPGRGSGRFLVLDTSDAADGFIRAGKAAVPREGLGSDKKLVLPGDVLVSRLRPYLRQIGLCDDALGAGAGEAVRVVCSTEFFVLRPRDEASIAFLVPFLLSADPQRALAVSVEGGHHPRFSKEALLQLPVPGALLESRGEISRLVLEAVLRRRESERLMASAVGRAG